MAKSHFLVTVASHPGSSRSRRPRARAFVLAFVDHFRDRGPRARDQAWLNDRLDAAGALDFLGRVAYEGSTDLEVSRGRLAVGLLPFREFPRSGAWADVGRCAVVWHLQSGAKTGASKRDAEKADGVFALARGWEKATTWREVEPLLGTPPGGPPCAPG